MKKKYILLLSLLSILVMNCENEPENTNPLNAPEACITVPDELLYETIPVTFSASSSKNASSYSWDFGDGNTANDSVVSNTYNAAGTYTVSLTVANDMGDEHQTLLDVTILAQDEIPEFSHMWDITSDETWEYGIHYIRWGFDIIDATVTIEPGAIIKFKENEGFSISGPNAAIIANGTETQPITFTADSDSPVAGYYYGINIDGCSNKTSFTNCVFEYGGGFYNYGGVLDVNNTDIEFSNNIIRHTYDKGLEIGAGCDIRNFNNNTFTDCGGYSLSINGNAVQNIGTNNTLDDDEQGVLINSGIDWTEVTWRKLPWPYIVPGTLSVGSETGTIFTIEPGVIIKNGGTIEFGLGSTKKCKVIAEGSSTEKIIFTSKEESPQKGDWYGLRFGSGNDSTSSLRHCTVKYADFVNTTDAAIGVHYTSVNINDCEINNVDIGFYLSETGYFQSFSNNIITADLKGLIIHPNNISTIEKPLTINAPIDVEIIEAFLTKDATWPMLNYFVNTYFYVGVEGGCTLTLQPGTSIKIMNGRTFSIGKYDTQPGGLVAIGTPENPITFTSENNAPQAGDWEHIYMGPGTKQGTIMDNCVVEYCGEMNNTGGIYIYNTDEPTVQNSTIRYSADYGIVTYNCTPTFSNNIFENNAKADYYQVP